MPRGCVVTRDLASLARTLDALRALHLCPTCAGGGEQRSDDGDVIQCRDCRGTGIAVPGLIDAEHAKLLRRHDDDYSALALVVNDLRDRLDVAERTLARLRAWRPCPACAHAGGACTIPCAACGDTGVAVPTHNLWERVIA